jgi:hypothetical protein
MEVQAHTFLTLALDGGEWIWPWGKGPRYPLHRMFGGSKYRSGQLEKEKNSLHLEDWKFKWSAIFSEAPPFCFLMTRLRERFCAGTAAEQEDRRTRRPYGAAWSDSAAFSVGIATGYGIYGRGSIPGGAYDFLLLHSVQTVSWAHPASENESDPSPQSSVDTKNGGVMPPLQHTSSRIGA